MSNKNSRSDDVKSELYGFRLMNPDISIMIPTYKREVFLEKTIKSVLRQKTQYSIEIVIVDNNPDKLDKANIELIKHFNTDIISYYRNESNIGMFGNWNRCIELAKSDWILILHDDDEICDNYVENMLRVALKYRPGVVTCGYHVIDENNNYFRRFETSRIKRLLTKNKYCRVRLIDFYFGIPIKIWGALINKKSALKTGGFDSNLYPCGDTAF